MLRILFTITIPALIAVLFVAGIWLDIPVRNFADKLGQTLMADLAIVALIFGHRELAGSQHSQVAHFASFATAGLLTLLIAFHIWFGLPIEDASSKLEDTAKVTAIAMVFLFAVNANRAFRDAWF